jgi:hypothetical protein
MVLNGYINFFHKGNHLAFYFKNRLKHRFVNQKLLFSVTQRDKKEIEQLYPSGALHGGIRRKMVSV